MALSKDEVRQVARLARLALTEEEVGRYAGQLDQVLAYVARLEALDVSQVEPMSHPEANAQPERADLVRPSLARDEALAAAPQAVGEGFAVPRIIE